MKNKIFAVAMIVAATAVASSPAHAWKKYYPPKSNPAAPHSSSTGKLVVGCIMGSALGAIGTALRVSRAENRELTQNEAWTALSFCGLGSFTVASHRTQVQPVVTRY